MTIIKEELSRLILVVEDIEETRDGIEKLLKGAGYRVASARTPEEAVQVAIRQPPDLILVSLSGSTDEVIQIASRIRQEAGLDQVVPIVIFCIEEVPEGEEVTIGHQIYLTRLSDFDQLKTFFRRLLSVEPLPA